MTSRTERGFLLTTALAAFAWVVARACLQSVTVDEADTYMLFASQAFPMQWHPSPNNHILNSVLMRLFTRTLGLSHLTLRLPALLGAVMYIGAASYVAATWVGRVVRWPLLLCLLFSPFIQDHLVVARGYSLALGFLMLALAVLGGQIRSGTVEQRACKIASACIGFSFAANFSFAYVDAMALLLFLAWALQREKKNRVKVAITCIWPGLLVTTLLCAGTLWRWPHGQLVYGAHSWAEMWDSIVSACFDELNIEIVNPLLHEILQRLAPLLPFLVLGLLALNGGRLLLQSIRPDKATLRATAYTLAVVFTALLLHGIAFAGFGILLPRGRTALFFAPLILIVFAMTTDPPSTAIFAKIFRAAGIGVLGLCAFYSLGCMRLTYFKEWRFDADSREAFTVLQKLNRRGVYDIFVEWRVASSLNFYRRYYHDYSMPEFARDTAGKPYPENRSAYVCDGEIDRDFILQHNLKIIYQGSASNLAIAVNPAINLP